MDKNNRPYNASSKQGGDRYPGIDTYEPTILKKGTKVCSLIAYNANGTAKPYEFYFPQTTLAAVGGSARRLCEGLQISPWRNPQSGKFCYKNRVALFRVTQDLEVEYSPRITENTCYGEGGIIQYHIPPEVAKQYLVRDDEDTILTDEEIAEEEYELIMEKKEQILLKRNLFSYLKSKVDTLDIIQNAKEDDLVKEAQRNLETINLHIDNLIMDLAFSQEQISDVPSAKYDKMIALLWDEIEIREQQDTLLVNNVKISKEIDDITHSLSETVDFNLITNHSEEIVSSIERNLNEKIETSGKKISQGEIPDIDIEKHHLHDILNIQRFNTECSAFIENNGVRAKSFLPITRLIMQSQNGEKREYKIDEFLTNSSVQEMKGTYNGEMTPVLTHKESGTLMKFFMRGNKPQLYIGQSKEKLSMQLDHLRLDTSQKERLLSGGEITLYQKQFRIDAELNTLIPLYPSAKDYARAKQASRRKRGMGHKM